MLLPQTALTDTETARHTVWNQAELAKRVPGAAALFSELDALRPQPVGCYAALAEWAKTKAPIPGYLCAGDGYHHRTAMFYARAYEARWQEARRRIARQRAVIEGRRAQANAAPPPDLFPSIRDDIQKAKQFITRAAQRLELRDLCKSGPIYEQVECLCDLLVERTQVVRDQKSELEFLKQRLAQLDGAPHAGQSGPDPSVTHTPARAG